MIVNANDDRNMARRLSVGLFLGGIACLVLTGAMKFFQGDSLAVTQPGRWLSSLSSVAVDIIGLLLFGMAAAHVGQPAGGCRATPHFRHAGVGIVVDDCDDQLSGNRASRRRLRARRRYRSAAAKSASSICGRTPGTRLKMVGGISS
jgi:hypothetical protein